LSRRKSVLFVSHDASRAGAPIIHLNFLNWFKNNTDIPFKVLLANTKGPRGELVNKFEELAELRTFETKSFLEPRGPLTNTLNHYVNDLVTKRIYMRKLRNQLQEDNIGLIYSNTIVNGGILRLLSFLDCPVITHVHELDFWITHRAGPANLKQVKEFTNHYIAVSQAVKNNLVTNHNIPESTIDIVYGFIPTDVYNTKNTSKSREEILKELQIPKNAFIVGASGTTDWRKAPDLFIQLARCVHQKKHDMPVHFIWVGGDNKGIQFKELWYDVLKSGLEKYVHFTGVLKNPLDYYNAFDVFALVSREDPFPLVMLEAASLGKPTLCFEGSGGANEFVQNDCGISVPYLNVETMADKVLYLQKDSKTLNKLGNHAAQKIRKNHQLEHSAAKVVDIIDRFL
jgi:glycosyltransferase involved in cell wall biosynthesis